MFERGNEAEVAAVRGTRLRAAATVGDAAAVAELVEAGTGINDADEDGRTGLWLAAWGNHSDVAAELIDSGADLDRCSRHGETALMAAAVGGGGPTDVLELLLWAGADWRKVDDEGRTAAVYAEDCGIEEATAVLAAWEAEQLSEVENSSDAEGPGDDY